MQRALSRSNHPPILRSCHVILHRSDRFNLSAIGNSFATFRLRVTIALRFRQKNPGRLMLLWKLIAKNQQDS
jgi:hypothetical protein